MYAIEYKLIRFIGTSKGYHNPEVVYFLLSTRPISPPTKRNEQMTISFI